MDPKVESAVRRACDQLGINTESFLAVVRASLNERRQHPAVKVKRVRQELVPEAPAAKRAGQDGG